jgi:hypothetical protein
MHQDNNTNNPNKKTLSQTTNTVEGTSEQGALKTIHKSYNKLNGYEAMLHIINRFRFVLYPFILLSVAGSSYSFYNDFIKAFPMLGDTTNLTIAIFFSVMLEIFRDGSLIALFNSKMNKPSRLLVSGLFVIVTAYMYSSHLKAIDVIEQMAIEYTLTHQDEKTVTATNPAYAVAVQELSDLKQDLERTRAEKTDSLITNSTSMYKAKREDALSRIDKIDKKVDALNVKIKSKNNEIIGYKDNNIKTIEESQKLISNILLATLLLVESLAMLGAVIKFINKDNADKEVAKHSEIVEEYVQISEQMKQDNEELTKQLSSSVQAQSQSNQAIMQLVTEDLKQSSAQNIEFIHAIAQNKNEIMQHMNEVLTMIANQPNSSFSSFNQPLPQEPTEPTRKIGFQAQSNMEIVSKLFNEGNVKNKGKLISKTKIIDVRNRTEDRNYKDVTSQLLEAGAISFKTGHGYYAVADYQTALSVVGGV